MSKVRRAALGAMLVISLAAGCGRSNPTSPRETRQENTTPQPPTTKKVTGKIGIQ